MMFSFTACSGSDSSGGSGGGSGGGGWYADRINTSFPVTYAGYGNYRDFVIDHINEFFGTDGRYGGYLTLPDGMGTHGPAYMQDEINVVHITSGNTLEMYEDCGLYKVGSSGTSGKTLLYRVSGSPLGEVAYYASSAKYYSYTQEGNVMTVYDGNDKGTITINSDGLVIEGDKWKQFTLGQTFTDNINDDAEISTAISLAQTISKTATVIGEPTFHKVKFQCTFGYFNNTTSVGIQKVFAYSKNRSDLENISELTSRYLRLSGGVREVHTPANYVTNFNGVYANDYDNGYLEDGDLRFADEGTANLSNYTATYDELDVTIYYCPLVIVANKAFAGEIKSVTMRHLKETSGFVDLGLSCKWSATNNKASSPWDFGSSITLLDKNVSGEGRLPTKEELLELNQCTIEPIDNGVLVTGLNGNQIFIPFCNTKGNSLYPGYGTSSTQTSGSSKYDVLFGFDNSTKKFTTYKASNAYNYGQYTMHTNAYVRPVIGGSGGGSYTSMPFEISNVFITNVDYDYKVISNENTGIYSSETQYLAFNASFKVNQVGTYQLKRLWYNPGSSTANYTSNYTLTFDKVTEEGHVSVIFFQGWGGSTSGHWKAGTYRWDFYYDDKLVFIKEFTIY